MKLWAQTEVSQSYTVPTNIQLKYKNLSLDWCEGESRRLCQECSAVLRFPFHKQPANNFNKTGLELRGIVLKSALFARAKDLCTGILDNVIKSENGMQAFLDSGYKRDTMSVLNEVFREFN